MKTTTKIDLRGLHQSKLTQILIGVYMLVIIGLLITIIIDSVVLNQQSNTEQKVNTDLTNKDNSGFTIVNKFEVVSCEDKGDGKYDLKLKGFFGNTGEEDLTNVVVRLCFNCSDESIEYLNFPTFPVIYKEKGYLIDEEDVFTTTKKCVSVNKIECKYDGVGFHEMLNQGTQDVVETPATITSICIYILIPFAFVGAVVIAVLSIIDNFKYYRRKTEINAESSKPGIVEYMADREEERSLQRLRDESAARKVAIENQTENGKGEEKQQYSGFYNKCPFCGDLVASGTERCPKCKAKIEQ